MMLLHTCHLATRRLQLPQQKQAQGQRQQRAWQLTLVSLVPLAPRQLQTSRARAAAPACIATAPLC